MKSFLIRITVVCLLSIGVAQAQNGSNIKLAREDLLREILNAQAIPATYFLDASLPGSYAVDKIDLLKQLAEAKRDKRVDLRGTLFVGPTGTAPILVYYFYSFIATRAGIQVIETTLAMGRITYKATKIMTVKEFQSFSNKLIEMDVLYKNASGGQGQTAATNEPQYNLLLARWSGENLESYYGSVQAPKNSARVIEFGNAIGELIRSLSKTYPNTRQTSPAPPARRQPQAP